MSAVAYKLPNPSAAPRLELLPSLPSAESPSALVYRRRRVLALLLAVLLASGIVAVAALAIPSGSSASEPVPELRPVSSGTEFVVRPGDTLWSMVTRAHPGRDPRPLVSELSKSRQGAALQVGERIRIP